MRPITHPEFAAQAETSKADLKRTILSPGQEAEIAAKVAKAAAYDFPEFQRIAMERHHFRTWFERAHIGEALWSLEQITLATRAAYLLAWELELRDLYAHRSLEAELDATAADAADAGPQPEYPREQEIHTLGHRLDRAANAYFNRLYADNDRDANIDQAIAPYLAEMIRLTDLYAAAHAKLIRPRSMSLDEARTAEAKARQRMDSGGYDITQRFLVEHGVTINNWKENENPPEDPKWCLDAIYDHLEADWNLRAALVAAGQPLPPAVGSLCHYRCASAEEARERLETLRAHPLGFDDDDIAHLEAHAKELEDAASRKEQKEQKSPFARFKDIAAAHVGCKDPVCFIQRSNKGVTSSRAFNMTYSLQSNAAVLGMQDVARYRDNAAKFAMSLPELQRVTGMCYRPENYAEMISGKFNMWIDPQVEELDEEPTIFLEHMAYLIPNDEERRLFVQWLAWCIRHPDQKIMFAVLIVGRGGTGKSWIGYLLEKILGKENVVLLRSEDAATEKFNGFSENKRVAFIHEIQPKSTKVNLTERVKGLITEETIDIRRPFIDRYWVENRTNLIAISNHDVPLLLNDRRWLVIRAADDVFAADDVGKFTPESKAYYDRLFGCLKRDEPRRVLHYLRHVVGLKGFDGKALAPITNAKEEIADGGDDTPQARIARAYKERSGVFAFDLFTAKGVAQSILGEGTADRGTSTWMEEAGCRVIRPRDGVKFNVPIAGGRSQVWAINKRVAAMYADATPKAIADAYAKERQAAADELASEVQDAAPADDDLFN